MESNEPRTSSDDSSVGLAALMVPGSATGVPVRAGERASKKPGARSGPRLVVSPVGGPAACGYLEMGADLPRSTAPIGAAVRRSRCIVLIFGGRLHEVTRAGDLRAAGESRGAAMAVST
jgi:hypothetical protein